MSEEETKEPKVEKKKSQKKAEKPEADNLVTVIYTEKSNTPGRMVKLSKGKAELFQRIGKVTIVKH